MMLQQQQWKVTNAPRFFLSVPDKKYKFPNGCAMVGEAIKDIEHLLVSYNFFLLVISWVYRREHLCVWV